MPTTLTNEPCGCPEGHCDAFVEPANRCINRRRGVVTAAHCSVCHPDAEAYTWHEDGKCLACAYLSRLDNASEGMENVGSRST